MRLNFKLFSQMPIRDQSIGKVLIYVKGHGKTIFYIFPMTMIYSKQSNSRAECWNTLNCNSLPSIDSVVDWLSDGVIFVILMDWYILAATS